MRSQRTPDVHVKYVKVSHAKEVPSYKAIPKYNHVPLACINPSPKKLRPTTAQTRDELEMNANPLKLKHQVREKKELEPHLIRVPFDPNATPKQVKTFVDTKGMTQAQKKAAKEAAAKAQVEAVKLKKMKRNLAVLFTEIKNKVDQVQDSDQLDERISLDGHQLRLHISNKHFVSYLYFAFVRFQDPLATKPDLQAFVKIFVPKMLDSEISEILYAHKKKQGVNTTTDSVMSNDPRMDITLLDPQFDKWLMDNEALNGVLNARVTKGKNQEFRLKLNAWKSRVTERKRIKKRTFEQGKKIRDDFQNFIKDLDTGNQAVQNCQYQYHNLVEDLQTTRKEEKTCNDLLENLPDVPILESFQIDKLIETQTNTFNSELRILERFTGWVKADCVLDHHYFNFHDIPNFILQRKITKTDYKLISKLLLKVKRAYLLQKQKAQPSKSLDDLNITDDDQVPLDLFDVVLSQIKHKFDDKRHVWLDMMNEAKSEITKKIKAMEMENGKQKKQIQESVLISYLNSKLEQTHTQSFNHHYKHALIYRNFQQQKSEIRSTDEFAQMFEGSIEITERDQQDYKTNYNKEMNKFNGRGHAGDGTESDRSSLTHHTGKSGGGRNLAQQMNQSHDRQDLGEGSHGDSRASLNQGLMQMDDMDEEDDLRDRYKNDQQRADEEAKYNFKDLKTGQSYDPSKKFGVIETEGTLLYDDITTAYPLNLPVDYYHKYVQSQIPKESDGKWFIRPHHVENLTQHPSSIRDNVLNTHYYSHYNQQHGKEPEVNDYALAVENIEKQVAELKEKQMQLSQQKGRKEWTDEDADILRANCQKQAVEQFEKFMGDKHARSEKHELIVDAYESIMLHGRKHEQKILNYVRDKEYQKNRPPANQWYSLKNNTFNQECYRNRVALKPNNENSVYLDRLQDKAIY